MTNLINQILTDHFGKPKFNVGDYITHLSGETMFLIGSIETKGDEHIYHDSEGLMSISSKSPEFQYKRLATQSEIKSFKKYYMQLTGREI